MILNSRRFTKEQAYKTRETQKGKKQKKQNSPFNAQHHTLMHAPLPHKGEAKPETIWAIFTPKIFNPCIPR